MSYASIGRWRRFHFLKDERLQNGTNIVIFFTFTYRAGRDECGLLHFSSPFSLGSYKAWLVRVTVGTILRLNILHCTEYMTCFPSLGRLRYFRNRMESSNWITKTKAERRLQKNTIQVTNIQNSVQHDKVCVAWYWQFLLIHSYFPISLKTSCCQY